VNYETAAHNIAGQRDHQGVPVGLRAGRLPARNGYGGPHLTSVAATLAGSVYAVGTGGSEVNGGPGAVLLRYDGHSWQRVASYPAETPSSLISGDGTT
jgi:hypothetical protein